MKERGIIMTGESVRAILAGRKTQTRRLVQNQAVIVSGGTVLGSRFGDAGDHLWVREALIDDADMGWVYEADKMHIEADVSSPNYAAGVVWMHHQEKERCSSRHMPKWATRLWLEVTGVRVERLQDITEADAIAEGVERFTGEPFWRGEEVSKGRYGAFPTARDAYASKWDDINGKTAPWASNPWVWVIDFRRVMKEAA